MPSLTQPLRFEPYLRPMVWGGRRLASVLHKRLPTEEPFGESWEVSDHPSHRTVVAEGPLAGVSLAQLMREARGDLLGSAAARYDVFPWLIKYLDARDWLSVQVHPDDERAKVLWPGEAGKTEVWFILAVDPGARIWAGLNAGTSEPRFRAALEKGNVVECLHEIQPKAGQCIFLPAGTVHAVGGGVLLAEVQQTSDATFRLFDWNRKDAHGRARTLHIEQGLAAMNWPQDPVNPIRVDGFHEEGHAKQSLVRCPYFEVQYLQSTQPITLEDSNQLRVAMVLAGAGRFTSGETVQMGQVWVIPASAPALQMNPASTGVKLLYCTLPKDDPVDSGTPEPSGGGD